METPSPDTRLSILANAPMGIMITDDAGLILWCNDTLANWAGNKKGNCVGRTEAGLLNCDDKTSIPTNNGPYKLGDTSTGKDRWILRVTQDVENDQRTVYYLDVTEEENLRRERTQLAKLLEQHNTVDSISGLLNHRGILKGLDPLVSRSRRYQNPLSIVAMTITNAPDVEQAFGHTAVDKMTLVISQLLRDQLRWADLVGREDTGNYIFVLPETDQKAAVSLANKIADQLNELSIPVDSENNTKPVACFGVASWAKGNDGAQLMAKSIDAAVIASQQGAFTIEAA